MFRYFKDSTMLSQGVLLAFNSGGDVNEIDRACRAVALREGVPDVTSWFDAWTGVASMLTQQAEADEAHHRAISAAHKYRRAAVYYAMAERYTPHTDSRKADAYAGMRRAFHRYASNSAQPVEFVEVPYDGRSLPALFIPAGSGGPAPTVVFVDGFDLYKELVYLRKNATAARSRGMAMLIVDTPGVGEALRLRGMTARYDTEVPVGACVDYLESRGDVDADRIGLIGLSLGGYYAPRAAAYEKRIKCCVSWGAQWDLRQHFRSNFEKGRSHLSAPHTQLLWVTGQPSNEAALEFLRRFTLAGVVQQITVPFLVVHGEKDHLAPMEDATRCVEGAVNSPRAELAVTTAEYGGEGHCNMDGMQTGVDLIYDWLAEALGGVTAGVPRA
jgi:dienelactone hydrolase